MLLYLCSQKTWHQESRWWYPLPQWKITDVHAVSRPMLVYRQSFLVQTKLLSPWERALQSYDKNTFLSVDLLWRWWCLLRKVRGPSPHDGILFLPGSWELFLSPRVLAHCLLLGDPPPLATHWHGASIKSQCVGSLCPFLPAPLPACLSFSSDYGSQTDDKQPGLVHGLLWTFSSHFIEFWTHVWWWACVVLIHSKQPLSCIITNISLLNWKHWLFE